MKKKRKILIGIGLLFSVFAFLINTYSMMRILLLLIGIAFVAFSSEKKFTFQCFVCFLLLGMSFFIDYAVVFTGNRIPIFSIEVKSSKTISTYNSFFYRVYDCNHALIFDAFYTQSFQCKDSLETLEANSFLSNIETNYKKYRGKFIKLKGKVSHVSGNEYFTISPYEKIENGLNGQVKFSDNITLKVINSDKKVLLDQYKIYDEVTVIGRLEDFKNKEGIQSATLVDTRIFELTEYDTYEITAVENKKCESDLKLISKTDEYNYYSSCLEKIYVKYAEDNIYELSYVLTDKRMTYEKLIEDRLHEENDTMSLYVYDDFHIIRCKNSNHVIIGDKKLDLDTKYCESFPVIEKNNETEGIQ